MTSGLPDDSREADEREEARRLRDLRSHVKAARAAVTTTPGLAEILARDRQKAARFCARFRITEALLRNGAASESWADPKGEDDHFRNPFTDSSRSGLGTQIYDVEQGSPVRSSWESTRSPGLRSNPPTRARLNRLQEGLLPVAVPFALWP